MSGEGNAWINILEPKRNSGGSMYNKHPHNSSAKSQRIKNWQKITSTLRWLQQCFSSIERTYCRQKYKLHRQTFFYCTIYPFLQQCTAACDSGIMPKLSGCLINFPTVERWSNHCVHCTSIGGGTKWKTRKKPIANRVQLIMGTENRICGLFSTKRSEKLPQFNFSGHSISI